MSSSDQRWQQPQASYSQSWQNYNSGPGQPSSHGQSYGDPSSGVHYSSPNIPTSMSHSPQKHYQHETKQLSASSSSSWQSNISERKQDLLSSAKHGQQELKPNYLHSSSRMNNPQHPVQSFASNMQPVMQVPSHSSNSAHHSLQPSSYPSTPNIMQASYSSTSSVETVSHSFGAGHLIHGQQSLHSLAPSKTLHLNTQPSHLGLNNPSTSVHQCQTSVSNLSSSHSSINNFHAASRSVRPLNPNSMQPPPQAPHPPAHKVCPPPQAPHINVQSHIPHPHAPTMQSHSNAHHPHAPNLQPPVQAPHPQVPNLQPPPQVLHPHAPNVHSSPRASHPPAANMQPSPQTPYPMVPNVQPQIPHHPQIPNVHPPPQMPHPHAPNVQMQPPQQSVHPHGPHPHSQGPLPHNPNVQQHHPQTHLHAPNVQPHSQASHPHASNSVQVPPQSCRSHIPDNEHPPPQSLHPHVPNACPIIQGSQTFVPSHMPATARVPHPVAPKSCHTYDVNNLQPSVQPSRPPLSNNLQLSGQTSYPSNNFTASLHLAQPSNLQQMSHPHIPSNLPSVQPSYAPPPSNLQPSSQSSHPQAPPNLQSSASSNNLQSPVQLPCPPTPNAVHVNVPQSYAVSSSKLSTTPLIPPSRPTLQTPSNCNQQSISSLNYPPRSQQLENQITIPPLTPNVSLPPPVLPNAVPSAPVPCPLPVLPSPNVATLPPFSGHLPVISSGLQPHLIPACLGIPPNVQNLSKEEADHKWLENWLSTKQKKPSVPKKKDKTITVFKFHSLLKKAFVLMSELEKAEADLQVSLEISESSWKNQLAHALTLKESLQTMKEKLLQPCIISQIQCKLHKIKKKRDYLRRRHEERKREKRKKEQESADYIRELNRIQEQIKEKDLQLERENKLKKEADDILSEVRKKIHEAKKTQEKLRILEKLRQARKENSLKKGLHVSSESDENFKRKITVLRELMNRQLEDYNAEERALQVMLETEQEGQREKEAAKRLERLQRLINEKQRNIEECLFGDSDIPSPPDPLVFFWQYYSQAETSIEKLLHIRHQWDVYLVPPGSSEGSTIPHQWVTPDPPHDSVWDSALERE